VKEAFTTEHTDHGDRVRETEEEGEGNRAAVLNPLSDLNPSLSPLPSVVSVVNLSTYRISANSLVALAGGAFTPIQSTRIGVAM
jgi:hypothetical protein